MLNARFWTIVAMILAAAATRLIPHPPNMTAVFAMALFGGACLTSRWLAVLVPLAAMLISDVVLSVTIYAAYGFTWSPATYLCLVLTAGMGLWLRDRQTVGRVTIAAVIAGVVFFFVSNFAEWLGSTRYPQTPSGLVLCYLAGLPFALNTVAGNLLYSGLLFGGLKVFQHAWPALRQPQPASAIR